ncbi:hypothetical protein HOY80DRAFT_960765 [Tuber brumale]|nr:hypothetical protein HOY80DRAFT_960765 [Tuber brumale]
MFFSPVPQGCGAIGTIDFCAHILMGVVPIAFNNGAMDTARWPPHPASHLSLYVCFGIVIIIYMVRNDLDGWLSGLQN